MNFTEDIFLNQSNSLFFPPKNENNQQKYSHSFHSHSKKDDKIEKTIEKFADSNENMTIRRNNSQILCNIFEKLKKDNLNKNEEKKKIFASKIILMDLKINKKNSKPEIKEFFCFLDKDLNFGKINKFIVPAEIDDDTLSEDDLIEHYLNIGIEEVMDGLNNLEKSNSNCTINNSSSKKKFYNHRKFIGEYMKKLN